MTKTINEVLEEVFSMSPLPNELKTPKKRWKEGRLKVLAKINIINECSNYFVNIDEIECKLKPYFESFKPLDTEG